MISLYPISRAFFTPKPSSSPILSIYHASFLFSIVRILKIGIIRTNVLNKNRLYTKKTKPLTKSGKGLDESHRVILI